MPATSTVNRTERAVVAGAARRALGVVSGLARGGPVRDTADEGTPEELRIAALLHLGVVLAVAGAATALALWFFVLPAGLFVAVFGALTAVLVALGVRALRRLRLVAARGWLFWAGVGWALVVASGAYLTQLTGFVPHLLLACVLGMLVLGVLGAGAVQTAVAGLLAALWVGAAALVGESLLPGLVVLAVLFAFPVLARPSRLVGAAAAVLALALAVTVAPRLLPHTPAAPLAVVTAVATCGLLRAVVGRLSADGIGWVTTAVGVAALAVLPLPPVLGALRAQRPDAGVLLPVGVLLVAAALPQRARARLLPWLAGSVALVAALLLPIAALVTVAVGVAVAVHGWRRTRADRPVTGLAWLALAALLLGFGRPWYVAAALLVALGAGAVLLAVRLRRAPRPGSPVPYGTGVPTLDELPTPPSGAAT